MTPDAGRPPVGNTEGRDIITGSDDVSNVTARQRQRAGWSPEPAHQIRPPTPRPAPPGQASFFGPHTRRIRRPAAMLDPDTSWQAGRTDTPGKHVARSKLRARVLELHRANPAGLTDDELAVRLPDEDKGSIAKRRGDLVAEGALVNTGKTRSTRRGCAAIVWRIAP